MSKYYEQDGCRILNEYGIHDYDIRSLFDYNRHIAEQTVSIEPYGMLEFLITLKDGRRLIYDLDDKMIYEKFEQEDEIPDDVFKKEFSRRLKRRMLHMGVDQIELSEKTSVSQSAISKYINGTSMPSYLTICKIAKVLKCDVGDFIY